MPDPIHEIIAAQRALAAKEEQERRHCQERQQRHQELVEACAAVRGHVAPTSDHNFDSPEGEKFLDEWADRIIVLAECLEHQSLLAGLEIESDTACEHDGQARALVMELVNAGTRGDKAQIVASLREAFSLPFAARVDEWLRVRLTEKALRLEREAEELASTIKEACDDLLGPDSSMPEASAAETEADLATDSAPSRAIAAGTSPSIVVPTRLTDLQIGYIHRQLDRVMKFVSGPRPDGEVEVAGWCQAICGGATVREVALKWTEEFWKLGRELYGRGVGDAVREGRPTLPRKSVLYLPRVEDQAHAELALAVDHAEFEEIQHQIRLAGIAREAAPLEQRMRLADLSGVAFQVTEVLQNILCVEESTFARFLQAVDSRVREVLMKHSSSRSSNAPRTAVARPTDSRVLDFMVYWERSVPHVLRPHLLSLGHSDRAKRAHEMLQHVLSGNRSGVEKLLLPLLAVSDSTLLVGLQQEMQSEIDAACHAAMGWEAEKAACAEEPTPTEGTTGSVLKEEMGNAQFPAAKREQPNELSGATEEGVGSLNNIVRVGPSVSEPADTPAGGKTRPKPRWSQWAIGVETKDRWHLFRKHEGEWRCQRLLTTIARGRQRKLLQGFADGGGFLSKSDALKLILPNYTRSDVDGLMGSIKPALSKLRDSIRESIGAEDSSEDPLPFDASACGWRAMVEIGFAVQEDREHVGGEHRLRFKTRAELSNFESADL